MPRKTKTETDVRITIAAGLFVTHTRDIQEIANMLDTTERNVYRWSITDLWKETLRILDYKGDQRFRIGSRQVQKNTKDNRLRAIFGFDGNIINWDQVTEIEVMFDDAGSGFEKYSIYVYGGSGVRTIIYTGSLEECSIIMAEIKSEIANANPSGVFDVSEFKESSDFRERMRTVG